VDDTIRSAISWDVMGGVARRNWARNSNAMEVSRTFNQSNQGVGHITIPFVAQDELVHSLVDEKLKK
jgi:urocanate hydratase